MSDPRRSASEKKGLPPGSLIHVGNTFTRKTSVSVLQYNQQQIALHHITQASEILEFVSADSITWVMVEGLQDVDMIGGIGAALKIHPLVQEDILNTHQRPKLEEHDEFLYIVLKGIFPDEADRIRYEQISILTFPNLVLSFKERDDALFEPIIKRIGNSGGRFRSLGTDYLTYAILDTVVDENFTLMDVLDERITAIEEQLLDAPTSQTLPDIQFIKRQLIEIRRYVAPLRELLLALLRSDSRLIQRETRPYLNDVLDHALRVTETTDNHREILAGLTDIYISSVSNRMNEVMKVLTIFASIFIPLTFIAGVYGMNFDFMPELHWKWGYPALWIVFIAITLGLLAYFRRKNWW